jgi:hypothetical protein
VEMINKAVKTHAPPRKNLRAPDVTSMISGLIFAREDVTAATSHHTARSATISISRRAGSANLEQYSANRHKEVTVHWIHQNHESDRCSEKKGSFKESGRGLSICEWHTRFMLGQERLFSEEHLEPHSMRDLKNKTNLPARCQMMQTVSIRKARTVQTMANLQNHAAPIAQTCIGVTLSRLSTVTL